MRPKVGIGFRYNRGKGEYEIYIKRNNGKRKVGKMLAKIFGKSAEVLNVEIDEKYRGKGIFKMALYKLLKENKPKTIMLSNVKNDILREWSKRMGFRDVGNDTLVHYDAEELKRKLEMELVLQTPDKKA